MTGPLVDHSRLLDTFAAEGELLASSAAGADPRRDVPYCPGMQLGDLVRHVGSFYWMVLSWIGDGNRPTRWQRSPLPGQPVEDYLREGQAALLAELSAHDPDEGCPTWWPVQQTYGFWYRRVAHETTIHRIDVQQAVIDMVVGGIAEDIALDGIDEILTLWFTHRLKVLGVTNAGQGRVSVRAGSRHWIAQLRPDSTTAWRADPGDPADAVVSSDPTGMYRWLWGRWPPAMINATGDARVVAQLWNMLRLATH